MDQTMSELAYLAQYLGYGWCAGCQGQWVGEDFIRNGDSWEASTLRDCTGYKAEDRLKIRYKDFSFAIKDIKYGDPVIQDLKPQEFYTGYLRNDDPHEATFEINRDETATRMVTHETTSSWQASHELGISVSYTPPGETGGFGFTASYNFGYQHGQTTTDSEGKQEQRTFAIKTSKTLKANTKAKYRIMVAKTRTTVPYTATIIAKFSVDLCGFMRWGGGYNGDNTNYHNK